MNYKIVALFLLCASAFFLFGCTEQVPNMPFTVSQFVNKTTDLNYTLFMQGYYDGNCLSVDVNKISVIDCNNGAGAVDWNALDFPPGCSAGQAVQIIGNTLTCVSVGGTDTNWVTSWATFDANMKASYKLPANDTNAETACGANQFLRGDGACVAIGAGSVNVGLNEQVPFMNKDNNDFNYSTALFFDDNKSLISASTYTDAKVPSFIAASTHTGGNLTPLGATFTTRGSRGTYGVPSASWSARYLGGFVSQGWNGTAWEDFFSIFTASGRTSDEANRYGFTEFYSMYQGNPVLLMTMSGSTTRPRVSVGTHTYPSGNAALAVTSLTGDAAQVFTSRDKHWSIGLDIDTNHFQIQPNGQYFNQVPTIDSSLDRNVTVGYASAGYNYGTLRAFDISGTQGVLNASTSKNTTTQIMFQVMNNWSTEKAKIDSNGSAQFDGIVTATGFVTASKVPSIDGKSALNALDNIELWKNALTGSINYDNHYAKTTYTTSEPIYTAKCTQAMATTGACMPQYANVVHEGLDLETRTSEGEKRDYELREQVKDLNKQLNALRTCIAEAKDFAGLKLCK